MTTVKKNDFVEIDFTARANNEIFDTTIQKEAKDLGLDIEVKPLILSVGNGMVLKGFDDSLEGKEIGKKYTLNLPSDKAFGKRKPELIKTVPIKVFHDKQTHPEPGMTFQLDDYIVKILSVSGGRVIVDFNNPIAGKDVTYDYVINKLVTDDKEKVNAVQDFFFKMRFDFEVKDKKVIFKKQEIKPFVDVFKEKFKEMTGLEFEVESANSKEDKPKKSSEVVVEEKKASQTKQTKLG